MAKLTEPTLAGIKAGLREEIMDYIALVDAKDTPLVSMARKGSKPGNTYFRWQCDTLPAAAPTNVVDGTDVDTSTGVTNFTKPSAQLRFELANYVQVFRRAVRVSKLSEDIATVAGIRGQLARDVSRAMTMIKRDMETAFCSNQAATADTGSTQGYMSRGMTAYLNGTDCTVGTADSSYLVTPTGANIVGGGTTNGVADIGASAASSTLSESTVQTLLQNIYSITGQSKTFTLLAGTALKRAFTNLITTTTTATDTDGIAATVVRTLGRDVTESSYVSHVDIFEGDFGRIRIVPTNFIGTISYTTNATTNVGTPTAVPYMGYLLDMNLVEIRYGGNQAEITPLTDNGGGPGRLVETVASLVNYAPKSQGLFAYTS